jgi:energy-coupling factor transporter ATP-binding protein EcfA2
MELKMRIQNVKCIKDMQFTFPLEKGIYAITGENGSGKSTLIACASTVFYQMAMNDYFGKPQDASIEFSMGTATRGWSYNGRKWAQNSSNERMPINGFYEGSIIFGNRFKDTKLSAIRILDSLKLGNMLEADDFIKKNLGIILHNDSEYFADLFILEKEVAKEKGLTGDPYFYKTSNGELISQARMSTGENLLISILHSLKILYDKRTKHNDGRPCIVFLDEIELALHSSALKRLIFFLKEIAETLGLAIFFSTHSIELLREIKPQNIYYLLNNVDGSISVTNPCYPAYATRNLYSEDGYGNDLVILVEDDLAKIMLERIMIEKSLMKNIRVKILPTGGWANTLIMAYDVISSNLLIKGTKLAIVLDRDIQTDVPRFLSKHKECSNLKIDYLPIKSLEKYLRENLYVKVDNDLLSLLDTYIFQKKPLVDILRTYQKENEKDDSDGKILYGYLINELRSMRKERDDLIEMIVKFIMKSESSNVEELTSYLTSKINN